MEILTLVVEISTLLHIFREFYSRIRHDSRVQLIQYNIQVNALDIDGIA